MKKETLIAVIAFLLGIVITQNFIMKPQAPTVTTTELPVVQPLVVPPTVSANTPSPVDKKPMAQLQIQKVNSVGNAAEPVVPKRKPSMVGLMVDENSVNILERTIGELSAKAKMHREDAGSGPLVVRLEKVFSQLQ